MSKKSGNGNRISLNKISFWLLVSAAFLYVLSLIFNFIDVLKVAVIYLQAVAAAAMICVVAVLAWRYVANKPVVWKVLYFLVLLIALVGLIIPAVL